MKKIFTKLIGVTLGLAMAVGVGVGVAAGSRAATGLDAESFNTSYTYADQGTTWTASSSFEDAGDYFKSSSTEDCVASVSGLFTSKTITSDVVITLDIACYGNGDNPTSGKFGIYTGNDYSTQVTATQGGTLPTSKTYTSATYTVTSSNASSFSNNLAIKIASGTKLIRFRSFRVAFTYSTAGNLDSHTITYYEGTNGDYDGSTTKAFSVVEGGSHTVLAPASVGITADTGYIFDCWYDGTDSYDSGDSLTMGTNDISLTAQWIAGVALSYDGNGAISGSVATTYVVSGGTQTVASASGLTAPSGKQFAHWNTEDDDTGASYDPGDEIDNFTSPLTLYAIWEDKTYVNFDATVDSGTSPIKKSDITMSCSNGVLNNNSEYRFYKNSTLTFARDDDKKIGLIEFTGVSGNPISNLTLTSGGGALTTNGDNGSWEGAATSVTFTASVAQARATLIVVHYYVGADVDLDKESLTLTVGGSSSTIGVSSISGVTNPSYEWSRASGDDCVTLTNTLTNTVTIAPKGSAFASCVVTLTVNGDNLQSPVVREANIYVARPFTAENPYSVSEARSAIDCNNSTYLNGAYVHGIISTITKYNDDDNSITYWISDDGTKTNELEAYCGKDVDGANFSSESDVELGASVTITGNLTKYSSTYEFSSGNEIVSYSISPEAKIEKLDTQSSLSYKYTKNGNGVLDTLTLATTGISSGAGYGDWSGKTASSDAVYTGNSAGGNSSIQLRKSSNTQDESGIVTTTSGGKASKIVVKWNSNTADGRTLNVYGSNEAYTGVDQLYGDDAGTKLGTIVYGTSTELAIDGDYAYIGLVSNSGAMYIDEIDIQWGEPITYEFSNVAIRFGGSIAPELWNELGENAVDGFGVAFAKASDVEGKLKDSIADVENPRGFYKPVADKAEGHPDLVNGNYVWNLYLRISTIADDNYTEDYLNDEITAVAYIKLKNGNVVFLQETTASAASLAQDLIDDTTNDYDGDSFGGSLGYLASL